MLDPQKITSKVLEMTSRFSKSSDLSDGQLNDFVQEIYREIVEPIRNKLSEASASNALLEDIRNTSRMIIDVGHMLVVGCLKAYAMDISDAPYHAPTEKISQLKKHFFDVVSGSANSAENDILQAEFCLVFRESISNAQKNRKLVGMAKTSILENQQTQ